MGSNGKNGKDARNGRAGVQAAASGARPAAQELSDDGGTGDAQEHVIETSNLTKIYGKGVIAVHALRGVSVTVDRGEFVAIMGPSGSGKSTLMNILGCLDRPSEGAYVLAGEDVSRLSKEKLASVRNRRIGFVLQSYNLLPRLTAVKNVMLPLLYNGHQGCPDEELRERAARALDRVGLGDRIEHRPNELSGGQQQRVAIARALVNDPSLVLADEPTGNLDTKSGQEIMALLHELHGQGATIVMVTHSPTDAAEAQRIIALRDGEVVSPSLDGVTVSPETDGRPSDLDVHAAARAVSVAFAPGGGRFASSTAGGLQ
jgi:putative ABC transport system ATP-binding protein